MYIYIFIAESLDRLTDLVLPLFSGVENKTLQIPEWNEHPYGPEQLGDICYIIPVKDIRNLTLRWSIPDLHDLYKTNVSLWNISFLLI